MMDNSTVTEVLGQALTNATGWHCNLAPFPYWNQHNDFTADAQPDENRLFNCGPESLSMVIKYITGVELPADYIKDMEYGEGYTGYTDFSHMSNFAHRYAGIPSYMVYPRSVNELAYQVWNATCHGKASVGLFHFTNPQTDDGHLRPFVGINPKYIMTADPWTGSPKVEDYQTCYEWFRGAMIVFDHKRLI